MDCLLGSNRPTARRKNDIGCYFHITSTYLLLAPGHFIVKLQKIHCLIWTFFREAVICYAKTPEKVCWMKDYLFTS